MAEKGPGSTGRTQNKRLARAKIKQTEYGIKSSKGRNADVEDELSKAEKQKAREAREAVRKAHRADVEAFAKDNEILHQITDLALLANGLLKGKALADFIARSQKVVTDAYLK